MEPINSISITATRFVSNYNTFIVQVTCPVKEFILQKRFSEFVKLAEELSKYGDLEPLPPKTIWTDEKVIEFRKLKLEQWLQSILYSKNTAWRRSKEWCDFMNIPFSRNVLELPPKLDHIKWMQEYEILFSFLSQIKSVWNERTRSIVAGDSAQAQAKKYQAKKGLKQLQDRLNVLKEQLDHNGLVYGEYARRMDLLDNIQREIELLDAGLSNFVVSTGTTASSKTDLFNGNSGTKPAKTSRKFGVAQETVETRTLDDEGLLLLQQQKMQQQDRVAESIASTVKRQKEIAMTISDELDIHAKLLEDLDEAADNVGIRLKNADKKIQKLL